MNKLLKKRGACTFLESAGALQPGVPTLLKQRSETNHELTKSQNPWIKLKIFCKIVKNKQTDAISTILII